MKPKNERSNNKYVIILFISFILIASTLLFINSLSKQKDDPATEMRGEPVYKEPDKTQSILQASITNSSLVQPLANQLEVSGTILSLIPLIIIVMVITIIITAFRRSDR